MSYQHFFEDDSQEATPRQRSLRERPSTRKSNASEKRIKALKSKFLEDFDPEQSSRERRKLTRKSYNGPTNRSTAMFDDRGRYRTNSKYNQYSLMNIHKMLNDHQIF